ncbi:hypothetical protein PC123_g23749 [Phytophthora cactorum]|nr:hypothetical protein PC120_g23261 [Phytophthora cactorum]KAG4040712.1 hypothetical protein PC123_g23749 [Phytophthora cactorum]
MQPGRAPSVLCPERCQGCEGEPHLTLAVGKKSAESEVGEVADVYYVADVERNIISYGKFDEKGYTLTCRDVQRVIAAKDGGAVAFDVGRWRNVLIVQGSVERIRELAADVIMVTLEQEANTPNDGSNAVQKGTLVEFHKRTGLLSFDAVERLESDPISGIEYTDHRRVNCLVCKGSRPKFDSRVRIAAISRLTTE